VAKVKFRQPKFCLVDEAPFGLAVEEKFSSTTKKVGEVLSEEECLRTVALVLELVVDSETPVVKLLEQQPTSLNIDKLERRRYILSGSLAAFREFYREYKEQKVVKALLIFLCQQYKPFFGDLWPKHGILPPLGISYRALSPEETLALELPIRMRHHYILSSFVLAEGDLLELFELGFRPVLGQKAVEEWILPLEATKEVGEIADRYLASLEAFPEPLKRLLLPQAVARQGFLLAPLISYMALFTRLLSSEDHPLRPAVSELLAVMKEKFPEPFGLLPD